MKLKIARISVFAALVSVLCTLFVIDASIWRQAVTGKYFWFAATMPVLILSICFCARCKMPTGRINLRMTDWLVLLSAGYLIANFLARNGHPDLHREASLLMIPLYVAVRMASEDETMNRRLHFAILAVVLVEALWGLLQLYGILPSYHDMFKITGSIFNPGPYAGILAVGLPLALGYSSAENAKPYERWFCIVVLAAVLSVLPATLSRAAWLAAAAGCIPSVLINRRASGCPMRARKLKGRQRYFRIIIFCVSIAGLVVGLYSMKKGSADGRRLIWSAAMDKGLERPLFGHGYGRFPAVYGDAQAAYFLSEAGSETQVMLADSPEYAFNEYVQIFVETGIVGLLLFAAVIAGCGLPAIRRIRNGEQIPYIHCSFLAFLVFAAFSYPFSVLPMAVIFVFLLGMSARYSRASTFTVPSRLPAVGLACCMTIAVGCAYGILNKRPAYTEWTNLQHEYHRGDLAAVAADYGNLYPKLRHEKQFLFEYARCLSAQGLYTESNRMFEEYLRYGSDPMAYNCTGNNHKAMKEYEPAEAAYMRALQIVPNRHYPLFQLMNLYRDTGQTEKAAAIARKLLAKPVKIPSRAIDEMKEEASKIADDE